MTGDDLGAFTSAFTRLCSAYGREMQREQCLAYFDFLQTYPLSAVLDGMRAAALSGGRFLPGVGVIAEAITAAHGAGRGQQGGEGRPRCPDCDGTGFLALIRATGQVLRHEELRVWDRTARPTTPRADGRPHYAMVPCGICKPMREGSRVPTEDAQDERGVA